MAELLASPHCHVRSTGMASQSPLDHHRPLDCSLDHNILRGEYVDLSLLFSRLATVVAHPQAPSLQIRLEDLSPGSARTPITMVPWSMRTLVEGWSLLNICRSSAVRRPNLRGLSCSITKSSFAVPPPTICPWIGSCDLELWTVTFSGQTKPHCLIPLLQPHRWPSPLSERPYFSILLQCQ